jgi:hypothetical protein
MKQIKRFFSSVYPYELVPVLMLPFPHIGVAVLQLSHTSLIITFMLFCYSNKRTVSTTDQATADAAITSKAEVSGKINFIFKYYTLMFINQDRILSANA